MEKWTWGFSPQGHDSSLWFLSLPLASLHLLLTERLGMDMSLEYMLGQRGKRKLGLLHT